MDPHLHTLSLLAGERGLYHAVILTQRPGFVDELDVVASRGGDAVGSQGVLAWCLRGPLGVVNVENHVAFADIEVPGDDRGGVDDLNQKLFKGMWGDFTGKKCRRDTFDLFYELSFALLVFKKRK